MKTTQDISNECINSISREEALKRADKDGYVHFERFGSIHIDNWKEKSDREKAIEWWNNLDDSIKMDLCRRYFSMRSVSGISVIKSLTGREIEQIWRKETQQFSVVEQGGVNVKYPFVQKKGSEEVQPSSLNEANDEDTFDPNFVPSKQERPQVDFEMLNSNLMYITEHCKNSSLDINRAKEVTKNLLLFFNLLSKSSTFAHKAHKELNKLMK